MYFFSYFQYFTKNRLNKGFLVSCKAYYAILTANCIFVSYNFNFTKNVKNFQKISAINLANFRNLVHKFGCFGYSNDA